MVLMTCPQCKSYIKVQTDKKIHTCPNCEKNGNTVLLTLPKGSKRKSGAGSAILALVILGILIAIFYSCGRKEKTEEIAKVEEAKEEQEVLGEAHDMVNIKGLTLDEAEFYEKKYKFILKNKGETVSEYPKGTVAMQSIEEGETVHEGETVVIYVSSGTESNLTSYKEVLGEEGTFTPQEYNYSDIMNNPDQYFMKRVKIVGHTESVSKGTLGYMACVIDEDGNRWACVISQETAEGTPVRIDGTIYGLTTLVNVKTEQEMPFIEETIVYGADVNMD